MFHTLHLFPLVILLQTTAHTLCFVFALLALYPGEQEKLYQHIKSIIPDGRTPVCQYLSLPSQNETESLVIVRPTKKCPFSCIQWRKLTFDHGLPYNLTIHHIPAHSVFNETLRLFPPVSGLLLTDVSDL